MKLTKVDRMRIAVGKEKGLNGRGILYTVPNDKKNVCSMDEQIEKRVNAANKLYSVFFKSDTPRSLEKHFMNIVKLAQEAGDVEAFYRQALIYAGYEELSKRDNTKKFLNIRSISYAPAGKNIVTLMELHVRERMNDIWQKDDNRKATAEMLACICDGKKYKKKLEYLKQRKPEALSAFFDACKECKENDKGLVYVRENTEQLEKLFTELCKGIAKKCDKSAYDKADKLKIAESIENQLNYLENMDSLTIRKSYKEPPQKIYLNTFKYPYATEERMKAIIVRMRRTLKRGNNAEVALLLLQGLAQMDGKSLASVIKELRSNESNNKALMNFVDAVNKDFYKVNIAKSVRNIDVKIQPNEALFDLSNVNSEKHGILNQTLVRYASSKEESDAVLLDIKKLLLDYFPMEYKNKDKFLASENLWVIPKKDFIYFDYEFKAKETGENAIKPEKNMDMEFLLNEEKVNQKALKSRIDYVNYGKYLTLLERESDYSEDKLSGSEFRKYWLGYIKAYVEKNYVQKKTALTRENCLSTSMMSECWKEIIRFICGKYIDLGKAVYHFAMPEDMSPKQEVSYGVIKPEYEKGVSSFAYEVIKAEDTLQRTIANTMVSAMSAFTRAAIDSQKHEKKIAEATEKENFEDILFLKDEVLKDLLKVNAKNQLLRFYGGKSEVENADIMDDNKLVCELLSHLKVIRNENFHYTEGRIDEVSCEYTKQLWNNDVKAYCEMVRQRYYFNNVAMFYKTEEIVNLVKRLYSHNDTGEAQIPAFRTVWKRKDLPEYITSFSLPWEKDDAKQVMYEGALYFILKEIYYRDYIQRPEAAEYFFSAVDEYVKETNAGNDKKLKNAAANFEAYIKIVKDRYDKQEFTFGNVCQAILMEYNQQNLNKEENIYQHFKMLLPLCMRNGFKRFIEKNYSYLRKPEYFEISGEPDYLEDVEINCFADTNKDNIQINKIADSQQKYIWYTFAHFIHPRQLNLLIGDIKSYIQYREAIFKRETYAGQLKTEDEVNKSKEAVCEVIKKAEGILEVLEFVKGVSGRISGEFSDYYNDKEEYAEYLAQYIEFNTRNDLSAYDNLKYFCQNALEGTLIDIYADAEKPKVLRNIELARMYAGGDTCLRNYKKITKADIVKYYKEKDETANIQSKGLCESIDEQKKVIEIQRLKGRITLNEVTSIHEIINDLLGQLVSLSYLKERDEMYMLLGFYYMALRNVGNWNEELDKLETDKYHVKQGLVLHQIVSIFDFGTKLLYQDENGKWRELSGQVSGKIGKFFSFHQTSLKCALRLFEDEKYSRDISTLRNYVDHSKYYVKHDKSIMELYSEYYTKFFRYSTKLRKSVAVNLKNILEKYFIDCKITFAETDDKKNIEIKFAENLMSQKFTYKLKADNTGKGKKNVDVKIDARSIDFLEGVQQMLMYKKL